MSVPDECYGAGGRLGGMLNWSQAPGGQGQGHYRWMDRAALTNTRDRDGGGHGRRFEVLLPLTWCFGDSPSLCDEMGKERGGGGEGVGGRRVGRSSYRDSWLWGFRRYDKFGALASTAVRNASWE